MGGSAFGRRRAPEVTRVGIVDAAEALFAQQGYAVTSIKQICRSAGVSIGSFYHHFEDKAAVTTALLERAQERFGATLAGVDVGRPNTIESTVTGLLEGSGAAVYRALREAEEVEPRVAEVAGLYRTAVHGRLTATLKATRAHGDEEYALDAQSLAWTLLALLREAIAGRGQPSARIIAIVISHSAAARARNGR